ncbi:MAG TPA: zinc-binding dehydrogenase [Mycobacteriales bacterium]|nr:zinc-binding dehydrogenase [Mycobacteriales bacterium]
MTTMRAARFERATLGLTIRQVSRPSPGPLEVLVRVEACGICLSDVHLLDGSLPGFLPEVTPGHEAAGVVEAVGELVPSWQPGQRVVIAGGRPCGQCPSCARGHVEECLRFETMGFNYDGAWAEYVVVPYFTLAGIPDDLPFAQAAILADAVATPYAGLVRRGALRPGETVGLWGIGGLGTHAVQIARLVGAALIVAVDPRPTARRRALALGADHALDPSSTDVPAEIRRLTGGLGLDLTVDLVGANSVLAQAADCAGRFGRVLMIGLSLDRIELGAGVLFGVSSQTLLGHFGYRKRDLDQLVDLVSRGRFDVSSSISAVMPLEDVGRGVEQLRTKDGDPIRLVVQPQISRPG